MVDAEIYEPDGSDESPKQKDRKTITAAIGGMSLFLAVIADIGAHVIKATERDGEDADIVNAVLDALEARGDAADEFRAGLWGLAMLASSDEEEPEPEPRPRRTGFSKRKKGRSR